MLVFLLVLVGCQCLSSRYGAAGTRIAGKVERNRSPSGMLWPGGHGYAAAMPQIRFRQLRMSERANVDVRLLRAKKIGIGGRCRRRAPRRRLRLGQC